MDFVVYAPYVGGSTYNPTTKILTVAADNSSNTAIGDQVDYLYGVNYYNNGGAGFDKNTASVPVTLKHAQAKVSVSFTGAYVTVTNVTINQPVLKGSYAVNYTNPTAEVTWTPGSANSAVQVIPTADLSLTPISGSLLVVPGTPSPISFSYNIDGSTATLSHTITPTDTWDAGTHYTYNVSITPKEIKFNPTVSYEWSDVTGAPGTTL